MTTSEKLKVVNDNGDGTSYNVFTVRTNRRVYQELVELRGEVSIFIHTYKYTCKQNCGEHCLERVSLFFKIVA